MATEESPAGQQSSAEAEDLGIVDSLVQLSFLIHTMLGRVAAQHELSIIQVRLLGVLRDREPGVLQLAHYLNLDKSSMSGLIQRAEQRGLVQRAPGQEDRRSVRVSISASGRRLSTVVAEEVGRQVSGLVGCLTDNDRQRLSELASTVVLSGAMIPAPE